MSPKGDAPMFGDVIHIKGKPGADMATYCEDIKKIKNEIKRFDQLNFGTIKDGIKTIGNFSESVEHNLINEINYEGDCEWVHIKIKTIVQFV